jgi:nucleotide-binding universal stress UspA family protein
MSGPVLRALVPTDFSAHSLRALDQAFEWELRAPCEIHLLHVVERDGNAHGAAGELEHDYQELERVALAELHRIAPSIANGNRIAALQRHIRTGSPAASIVEVAGRLEVDVVMIGTHGRTGLRALLMGSVAREVLRHAPCPVLCVTPDATLSGGSTQRRIVCAVDFSECSRRAMEVAADLARHLACELILFHASATREESESALEEWKVKAEERAGFAVATAIARGAGAPPILAFAREQACELVVVGTHGQTGLLRVLMGSVAEAIVRAAPCPVLTVRPH